MAYLLTYFAYFAYFAYFWIFVHDPNMEVDWHASILFIRQLIAVRKLEAFQNHMFSAYKVYLYYTTTGACGCTGSNMRTSGQPLSGHVGLALILIFVWELEAFTNHLSEWVEQISWICKICKICWIWQLCTIHWVCQIWRICWICKIWNPHWHINPPFAYESPLF